MATWPVTLPQCFLQDSYQETDANLFVQTEMDAGPPKIRRRFTAGVRQISGKMLLTTAQKIILREFFMDYGADEIDYPDPEDAESTISVNFSDPPDYVYSGPNRWRVSIKFKELPS